MKKILVMIVSIVAFVAMGCSNSNATEMRTFTNVNSPATFSALPASCLDVNTFPTPGVCRVTSYTDRPTVLLWGDSHAVQQLPALKVQALATNTNLLVSSQGACPAFIATDGTSCSQRSITTIDWLETKVAQGKAITVVLAGHWNRYFTGTDTTSLHFKAGYKPLYTKLANLGVRVAVVGQQPVLEFAPDCVGAATCDRNRMVPNEAVINADLAVQAAKVEKNKMLDVTGMVCDTSTCQVAGLFYDDLHMDILVTDGFAPAFRWPFNR